MPARRTAFLVAGVVAVAAVVALFPLRESTYEFDAVNLRLRACSRYRSGLTGIVLRERCKPARDYPTAARLQIGVLPSVNERESRWVLIKGFKPGVRAWRGTGREYLRVLGAVTFGTPVPLPVQ